MSKKEDNSTVREFKRTLGIIIAVILCLYAVIFNLSGKQVKLPMAFGRGGAVVITDSMTPTIPGNSYIFVKRQENYNVGDIVAFENKREVIVHRIVSINGDEVITKGDANNAEDEPVTKDRIKGKVTFHIPRLGYVLRLFKSPLGSMILVLLAFVFLALSGKDKDGEDEKDGAEQADGAVGETDNEGEKK